MQIRWKIPTKELPWGVSKGNPVLQVVDETTGEWTNVPFVTVHVNDINEDTWTIGSENLPDIE